ncbi:MAG: chemotaxis protein CheB, partial [bacterium]|nr:chemotaxis protein CheB [bacterium]
SGAVDFIPKRSDGIFAGINELQELLVEKVKSCAAYRPHPDSAPPQPVPVKVDRRGWGEIDVVAIGASTGGPRALLDVIPLLPQEFAAAILVVQHMPKGFTATFAQRLNSKSFLPVKEAEEGDVIEPGRVLVAPGGLHLTVVEGLQGNRIVRLAEKPADLLFRPSVDVMMESVAERYGSRVLAVIMTGMGSDGSLGMRTVKRKAGITLAQDQESCVVYGMPHAAVKAGVVDRTVLLSRLAQQIVNVAQGSRINTQKEEIC